MIIYLCLIVGIAFIRAAVLFLQFQTHYAAADKLASLRQYLLLNASFRQELRRNIPKAHYSNTN